MSTDKCKNMNQQFDTPILFLIFNRPDTAQQVFDVIRKMRPGKLFIAADGPRPLIPDDREKCEKTREIIKQVDWDCEIKTLFREENLGCGKGPVAAIDWFFKYVERGIILEDDCLPDLSFFTFCEELLNRYEKDEKIMMISGDNFQFGERRGDSSYYFSRYNYTWGWATWRRAWKLYDFEIKTYPEFKKNNKIQGIWRENNVQKYWTQIFDEVYGGSEHIWDYQWTYAIWQNNGVSIVPNVNLVSNIGFGNDATHTKKNNFFSNLKSEEILNIKHPVIIEIDQKADKYYNKKVIKFFNTKNIIKYILRKLHLDYYKIKKIFLGNKF